MSYSLAPEMEQHFIDTLPQYARFAGLGILAAAKTRDLDPFLIFGIGDRESQWGAQLNHMAGDWGARAWSESHIAAFPHVTRVAAGPNGLQMVKPADGLGWGRGYMQLDYVDQYDWLMANDWRDPAQNIARGADVFISKRDFFSSQVPSPNIADHNIVTVNSWFSMTFKVNLGNYPDPRPLIGGVLEAASVAAYNAAKENVLRMIVSGGMERMDEVTTPGNLYKPPKGDYSQDVRGRAEAQRSKFMQNP